MTSSTSRILITLAFLGLAFVLPATVEAQAPTYLGQWNLSLGANGVATDAAGNVYVVDAYNSNVKKYSGATSGVRPRRGRHGGIAGHKR